jgi:hypothetical protein
MPQGCYATKHRGIWDSTCQWQRNVVLFERVQGQRTQEGTEGKDE